MTALLASKGKGIASRRARRKDKLSWDFTGYALMTIADDCAGTVCAGMVPALDFCCLSTLTTLPSIQCPREALSRAAMTFHSGLL
jgi:hypothetical protein